MTASPPPAGNGAGPWHRLRQRIIAALPWHFGAFLALNAALTATNIATGRPWWALWPLMITGVAVALHYFVYKTLTIDERWVDERVEELNLKSYDRSHIENIKAQSEDYERRRAAQSGRGPDPRR